MKKYRIKTIPTTDGKKYRIYQKIGDEYIPSYRYPTYYKKKSNAEKKLGRR